MPTRTDPYRSFNFRVEIDGLTVGSFRECTGLGADGNVVEYREGTDLARSMGAEYTATSCRLAEEYLDRFG